MSQIWHDLSTLFDQLGLESSADEIDAFIRRHNPLPGDILLHQANFWTKSQAEFIQESEAQDADWADVVNKLDVLLRKN